MSRLPALFRAECIKWRKNWPLVVAILAPVLQVGFLGLLFWFSEDRVQIFRPGHRFWLEVNAMAWNLVVLPVTVALIAHLSWSTEGDAKAWSHLLTQPTDFRNHYLVKGLSHLALVLLAYLLLAALLPVGAWLLLKNPRLALYMGGCPGEVYRGFALWGLAALVPLVAFHTWFSMRFPGIWAALAVALIGTWAAVQVVGRPGWAKLLPWGLSAQMSLSLERLIPLPWLDVPWGLGGALVLFGLGVVGFLEAHGPKAEG